LNSAQLRFEMARGERVSSFVNDEDIAKVFKELAQGYVNDVLADANSDSWHRYHALNDVLSALDNMVTTGRMAAEQLKNARA
jgi:argininosuccinate lyase